MRSAATSRMGPARSLVWGTFAAALLASFYTGVVAGTAGWAHLADTLSRDGAFAAFLMAGFGAQVAILVEVRRRHRAARQVTAAAGAGAGISAAAMVACCAHPTPTGN